MNEKEMIYSKNLYGDKKIYWFVKGIRGIYETYEEAYEAYKEIYEKG